MESMESMGAHRLFYWLTSGNKMKPLDDLGWWRDADNNSMLRFGFKEYFSARRVYNLNLKLLKILSPEQSTLINALFGLSGGVSVKKPPDWVNEELKKVPDDYVSTIWHTLRQHKTEFLVWYFGSVEAIAKLHKRLQDLDFEIIHFVNNTQLTIEDDRYLSAETCKKDRDLISNILAQLTSYYADLASLC